MFDYIWWEFVLSSCAIIGRVLKNYSPENLFICLEHIIYYLTINNLGLGNAAAWGRTFDNVGLKLTDVYKIIAYIILESRDKPLSLITLLFMLCNSADEIS